MCVSVCGGLRWYLEVEVKMLSLGASKEQDRSWQSSTRDAQDTASLRAFLTST